MAQLNPSVILLRNGTDTSIGLPQLISNINACQAVAELVKTSLGPLSFDKLIYQGHKATISNDGAEILKLMDIVHPAARALVDISKSQDIEVGDGTTSVTLIACEILKQMKSFLEDGVHAQLVIQGIREAGRIGVERCKELKKGVTDIGDQGVDATRVLLERVAGTALNSKLVSGYKSLFAPMCVDAIKSLGDDLNIKLVGIKKVTGGSVMESELVDGVAFQKTFAYAGFEQQPKRIENPKVLMLNVELELKSEKENAEVRIDDPAMYQSIVEAEWKIIYDKLDACVKCGATVVLSKLPIGDLATQYFADRNIFCAGRVQEEDVKRVCMATGAAVQSSVNNIPENAIGNAKLFEEKQVGGERYNFITGCPEAKTCTLVIRGGSEQFVEEAHRSLHDALMVVKRTMENTYVVPGGGAVEMELSRYIADKAKTIEGKQQLIMRAVSKALEIIPRQICDNAGLDSTDILNQLRQKHYTDPEGSVNFGVDVTGEGGICDTFISGVWEPAANKINSIASAVEAACLVLSVDETVKNPQSEQNQMQRRGQRAPPGGGMPMSAAMGGQGLAGMGGNMPGVRSMKGRGGK